MRPMSPGMGSPGSAANRKFAWKCAVRARTAVRTISGEPLKFFGYWYQYLKRMSCVWLVQWLKRRIYAGRQEFESDLVLLIRFFFLHFGTSDSGPLVKRNVCYGSATSARECWRFLHTDAPTTFPCFHYFGNIYCEQWWKPWRFNGDRCLPRLQFSLYCQSQHF